MSGFSQEPESKDSKRRLLQSGKDAFEVTEQGRTLGDGNACYPHLSVFTPAYRCTETFLHHTTSFDRSGKNISGDGLYLLFGWRPGRAEKTRCNTHQGQPFLSGNCRKVVRDCLLLAGFCLVAASLRSGTALAQAVVGQALVTLSVVFSRLTLNPRRSRR